MNIKDVNISEIVPYERNPRKNDNAVEFVANSIREFGFKQPIVIDKNNVIVAGHTRLRAAEKLGLETVPCVLADDLTDEQIKAYRLADNKTNEMSFWDYELLDIELKDIEDIDMSDFGFDLSKDFLPSEIGEDDFEGEIPEEPKTKRGDIYKLGNHRLMCGDSANSYDVNKLMGGVWQTWYLPTHHMVWQ